jgi:misacylated tRNA(Ala) deacylase|tara:strand:+ start:917 stop:1636 length:720 start_codon:yes stop_codon:yes gene_type:complete
MQEKLHMTRHPGINPPEFEANIVGITDSALFLSESYCYPRGGGQPGDKGKIIKADGEISDYTEVLPGEMIAHPIENPLDFVIGEEILCQIDSERRNAHTMMHTSQHIVSALAEDIWGAETVGNQLGAIQSRIDLLFDDKSEFDPVELVNAVNTVLSSSTAVNIHKWDRNMILEHEQMRHTKFLHKIPGDILRVVEIEGVDLCPCAGTHVSNTSIIPTLRYVGKKNKGKGRLRLAFEFDL